jgi:nitroreductase
MPAVSPSDALAALNWRYAVKKFDPTKRIPADTWATLEQSLLLSPSSYGLQPWKFFVVETPAVREQLLPHSWGQRQVVDADKLVVFAVKKDVNPADADRLIARTSQVRGVPAESLAGYRGMMAGSLSRTPTPEIDVWMSRQVFIALGVFLTTAAMVGVDACPMEGFVPEKYDEVLGLGAKGYASRVVATAGYRAADDAYGTAKKVRFELGEVVERV